jgi:hypothetical protein
MTDDRPVPTAAGRQARGLLAIATQLGRVTAPLRRRRGLTEAALFADWTTIVGASLSAECAPLRMARGTDGTGGTLHIRVTGPLALELQHLEPLVVERINGYFGYRAVARLALHQGPLSPRPAPPKRTRPLPDGQVDARLAPHLARIGDAELRDALSRLGREVLARRPIDPPDGEQVPRRTDFRP